MRGGPPPRVLQVGLPLRVPQDREAAIMLWTILVVLLVLWLLGFGAGIGGGAIHLILVVCVVLLVLGLVQRRNVP